MSCICRSLLFLYTFHVNDLQQMFKNSVLILWELRERVVLLCNYTFFKEPFIFSICLCKNKQMNLAVFPEQSLSFLWCPTSDMDVRILAIKLCNELVFYWLLSWLFMCV